MREQGRMWQTRAETAEDRRAVYEINAAAFETPAEADLVEALRADPDAWVPGFSQIAFSPEGLPAGYALITRCRVGEKTALALAPCAVLPEYQRQGAGSAAIRAALEAARAAVAKGAAENVILVLGHSGYYPRFGFSPASQWGIEAPFDVPDEAMMALILDEQRTVPSGVISYPAAFSETK